MGTYIDKDYVERTINIHFPFSFKKIIVEHYRAVKPEVLANNITSFLHLSDDYAAKYNILIHTKTLIKEAQLRRLIENGYYHKF